jgi:hypothetical protein
MVPRVAVVWLIVAGMGCGSRSDLRTSAGRSVTAPGQGGDSSFASSVPVGYGSRSALTGGMGGAPSSASSTIAALAGNGGIAAKTLTASAAQRWLAVTEGINGESRLSLVGIGEDRRLSTFLLPPWDTGSSALATSPVFSADGSRLCYTATADHESRVWAVSFSARQAVAQEVQAPRGDGKWEGQCAHWISSTLFQLFTTPQPSVDPMTEPQAYPRGYVMLSTDRNQAALVETASAGSLSPDGRWLGLEWDDSPSASTRTLHLMPINNGLPEKEVLTVANVYSYKWSEDSRRFAIFTREGAGTRVEVYDVNANGLSSIGTGKSSVAMLWSAAGFSADNRYIALEYNWSDDSGQTNFDPIAPSFVWDLARGLDIEAPHVSEWLNARQFVSRTYDVFGPGTAFYEIVDAGVAPSLRSIQLDEILGGIPQSVQAYTSLGPVWGQVGSSRLILQSTGAANQLVELDPASGKLTPLLPGIAGDAVPVLLASASAWGGDMSAWLVVANPSYYYLEFSGSNLRRSVRLTDFYGNDFTTESMAPDGVGLLAGKAGSGVYAWLYLDREKPGPLVEFSRPMQNPKFYLPWPKVAP